MKITAFFTWILCLLLLALLACNPPVSRRNILVIGDETALAGGWLSDFQDARGGGPLVNTARPGNTFGYGNGGDLSTSTLENLTTYLRRGFAEMGGVDDVIVSLGRNDCNPVQEQATTPDENFATLVERIGKFFSERGQEPPNLLLVLPEMDTECTRNLAGRLRFIGEGKGVCVVDAGGNLINSCY